MTRDQEVLEEKSPPASANGSEPKALEPPVSDTEPRRKRGRGLLWLALLAGLGFVGFRYYQAAQKKKAAAEAQQAQRMAHRSIPVAATAVRRGDLPIYLRGLGSAAAYNTVNVKSRVDGPLVAVNYKEGQYVNKGDVLVEV